VKILVVSPYDLSVAGGVTSHVNQVVKQLRRMGHEALLLGPASGALKPDRFTIRMGGTIPWPSPGDAARISFNPLIIRQVREFLSEREFDVFHLHEPFVPFLGPAILRVARGVKVGTYHAWRVGVHWPYQLSIPLIRFWDGRLDGRVTVSEWSRKTISRYVPGQYEIIPNGIEFSRFATPAAYPPKFRDSDPTILYVGRLEPRKGVEYLVRAFRRIKERIPRARLVIVGDGGLMPDIQKLARKLKLDDVFFEGFVPSPLLAGYYQRADLVCVPSTGNESFGIVLLEAMSAGTPVVASHIDGFGALLKDGVTGLAAEPRNPESFAEKVLNVLENPALSKELVENARTNAERYDWLNVASNLLDYYEAAREGFPARVPQPAVSVVS
jgi:phosphatidylinositol alpha-mannosyltransferase